MLQVLPPPPALAHAVEAAVALRRDAARSISCFPAMPRAMLTLQLPLHAAATEPPALQFHALSTRPAVHQAYAPFKALGLVLQPAAAAQLLGASSGVCVDATLPWAEVAGAAEARRLADALLQSTSDQARLQALFASLQRTLQRGPERLRAARAESLQRLVALVGRHGAQAAPLLAVSERQLERRCRALLALSPKQLQRLVRLQNALRHVVQHRAAPLADGALAAGYYDQSHLLRDVRQLAGAPLRGLLDGAHADGAWWPLATQRGVDQRTASWPPRHHR